MPYHANIVTFIHLTEIQFTQVDAYLDANGYPSYFADQTFYIGSTSIQKSRELYADLCRFDVPFVFYFVRYADGDVINGFKVDEAFILQLRRSFLPSK